MLGIWSKPEQCHPESIPESMIRRESAYTAGARSGLDQLPSDRRLRSSRWLAPG